MTDEKLRQLIESNASSITGMAQSQTTTLQGMDDFEQRLLTIEQKVQDLENQA